MKAFISKHLTYPKEALKSKVEGTVVLQYDIDHTGKVIDAKVLSGIGYGCDEEAVRLVKLLEFTIPKNRGVKVLFHRNMQIHFRLPKQKVVANSPVTSFSYRYIPKKKQLPTTSKSTKKSYSYSIIFKEQ
ncbi:MAG: energy transducer TonB [Bacteroidota bacterium]